MDDIPDLLNLKGEPSQDAEEAFLAAIQELGLSEDALREIEHKALVDATVKELFGQAQRNHTAVESRTDFAAIEAIYNKDAVALANKLRIYVKEARDSLLNLVERQAAQGPLSAEFAQSIKVSTGPEFAQDVESYLMDVWRRNRDAAIAELPEKLRTKLQGMKRYAEEHFAFCPTGEGGGIDNSCSPNEKGSHDSHDALIARGISVKRTSHQEPNPQTAEVAFTGHQFDPNLFYRGISEGELESILNSGLIESTSETANRLGKTSHLGMTFFSDVPNVATSYIHKTGYLIEVNGAGLLKRDGPGEYSTKSKVPRNTITRIIRIGRDDKGYWAANVTKDFINKKRFAEEHAYAVAFRPDVAGNYFHNRALLLRGIVDDELTRDAKFSIFETLKGGRNMNEAIGDLRSIFEPWLGDPARIEPSGISQTEEDILKPYRLENIVRTESTTAISQGRAAVADAASDFVVGFRHSSILDMRTSEVCQLADGITFRKDDPRAIRLLPPLHYSCRSIDEFVTSDDDVQWTSEEDLDAVVRLIMPEFK